ncbi:phage protein NinX family protein [Rouxiella sp. Mn2063]|uniref:phage protein NinX family protein n=1 Tax=Rouxiella sp. Mn2063 TaxID=3395262 RepID=UPI003BD7E5CC
MTDYSQLSDFEINKRVADIKIEGDWMLEPNDDRKFTFYNHGVESSKTIELPDYCNNPADAWPIIKANLISLTPYGGDGAWWEAEDRYGTGKSDCDNNPLRAAMIVYLMLKESESS